MLTHNIYTLFPISSPPFPSSSSPQACKAMAPYFYHLAERHPASLFVEVPVTADNSSLHQGLGVPSVPFGHIYHPDAGLVEESKVSRKVFGDFEREFERYVTGYCDLGEEAGSSGDAVVKNDDNDGERGGSGNYDASDPFLVKRVVATSAEQ